MWYLLVVWAVELEFYVLKTHTTPYHRLVLRRPPTPSAPVKIVFTITLACCENRKAVSLVLPKIIFWSGRNPPRAAPAATVCSRRGGLPPSETSVMDKMDGTLTFGIQSEVTNYQPSFFVKPYGNFRAQMQHASRSFCPRIP